ncbi:hypothetical protein A2856_02185 [Candidatus Uhrbacteria bacterium RIFCSPHIGHO2_01_FULL_63_20]|uniref:POTRA domain-containing protein n=1 Tax=Candidatus Uhrbacteria bacterium RIFCSPHIGHO2_01_FULL_63_20 TaxID=1802385 RepID=A0A1F7TLI6_9BACT|nr:MAG: hypothetical protein A2856_02185 [Candidatus Uhrbacteria bacterium RIFCSPHIGHO2_01_FULL_63_20]
MARERYDSRRFANPYFTHGKPRNRRKALVAAAFALTVGGLLGATGYLFASPRFDVAEVGVEGCRTIAPEAVRAIVDQELDRRAYLFLDRRNRFLFDPEPVRAAINASFSLDRLEVTREGKRVLVTLSEKVSQIVWKSADARFLVDLQGTVLRELGDDEPLPDLGKPLPAFIDVNRVPPSVGGTVLSADEVAGIFSFHEWLTRLGILFGTTRVDRLAGKWMSVETADGYDVLFDPLGDVQAQAENLNAVLHDQVKDPGKLQYVDLRFGDHVYFK